MAFHPRDDFLAIVDSRRSTVSIVDCRSGHECRSALVGNEIDEIAFSESGDAIVAVARDHIYTWDLRDSERSIRASINHVDYDLHTSFPTFVAVGDTLWLLCADRWQLWSIVELQLVDAMPAPKNERVVHATRWPNSCVITYDEQPSNHPVPTISLWDLNAKVCSSAIELREWKSGAVSHDASKLVAGDAEHFNVWDLPRATVNRIAGVSSAWECEFCSDNRHVVTSICDGDKNEIGSLVVTDTLSSAQRCVVTQLPLRPFFRCSPYSTIMATIGNDIRHPIDTTIFWNPLLGSQLGCTSGHVGPGKAAFSPNGRWFATASNVNSADTIQHDGVPGFVALTDLCGLPAA